MVDEDKTQPGNAGSTGDDLTSPGDGAPTPEEIAFAAIAAGVDRAISALRARADMGVGRHGEARHRSFFLIALAAGEAADHLHDLRRVATRLMHEEETKSRKGIP